MCTPLSFPALKTRCISEMFGKVSSILLQWIRSWILNRPSHRTRQPSPGPWCREEHRDSSNWSANKHKFCFGRIFGTDTIFVPSMAELTDGKFQMQRQFTTCGVPLQCVHIETGKSLSKSLVAVRTDASKTQVRNKRHSISVSLTNAQEKVLHCQGCFAGRNSKLTRVPTSSWEFNSSGARL